MKIILACIDYSDVTHPVLDAAAEQARLSGAKVHLLHVAPIAEYAMYSPGAEIMLPVGPAVAVDVSLDRSRLLALAAQMAGIETSVEMREGNAVAEILDEIKLKSADMVVIGSHGHSAFFELIVGSVTEGVLRRSTVPVLVVPSRK